MLEFLYSGDYSVYPRINLSLRGYGKALDSSLDCKFKLHNAEYGRHSYCET